jgi:hypothetical protein
MNKKLIGGVLILSGVAVVGYYLLNKKKPTISALQLSDIDNIKTDVSIRDNTEQAKMIMNQPIAFGTVNTLGFTSTLDDATQAQINQNVKNIMGNLINPDIKVDINIDALNNLGWDKIDWSKVDWSKFNQTSVG